MKTQQETLRKCESGATKNSELNTQNLPLCVGRSCGQCACAAPVWNGRREWLLCANYPGHEGELTHVSGTGIVVDCRKFWPRCAVAAVPPEGEGVRYISLGDGRVALVDAADYEWLRRYTWRASGAGYAQARVGGKHVFMHRLIMNPAVGKVVDHWNGNRQDNRRGNLRLCTQAQNLQNRRKSRGTSRFKGVSWHFNRRRWEARIGCDGKTRHLGWFDNEIDAALAYDRAARELFGAFAHLNFPEVGTIVRPVAVRHRQDGASCRCHPTSKSEIRSTKSETNSNHRNSKLQTKPGLARAFGSLEHLDFGHCFEFRYSNFRGGLPSGVEIPRLWAWATGPPQEGRLLFDNFIGAWAGGG